MPGEIPTPEQEQVKPTLKEAIVQTREAKVSALIENDAKIAREKAEARAAKKIERQEARAARREKFNEAKDKTVNAVKEARAWDRKVMFTLFGEVAAVPKTIELTAKAGAEAGKNFLVAKKNEVVDAANRTQDWLVDTMNTFEDSIDNTIDTAEEWVGDRVADVTEKYNNTKDAISTTYLDAKTYVGLEAQKQKDKVVKGWRRVRAVPVDVRAGMQENRANRIQKRLERDVNDYVRLSREAADRRAFTSELKGTKTELASVLA